ncbi:MAG: phosphoribosylamine--glycine ligase [Pyrinomonadaceae bacterium]
MKILVIGSGGREHAITWALQKVPHTDIYCAPGNAGMAEIAITVPISVNDGNALARFAREEMIDLTFVGPEAPLVAGLVNQFHAEGLRIVGPTAEAARLEGSKAFAKDFMARHLIPTARYRIAASAAEAEEFLKGGQFGNVDSPVIIKADGLAAGKGVVVASNHDEAFKAIEDLMINYVVGKGAADKLVIEERLFGEEISLLLFSDGRDYALMPAARDHKRLSDADKGPNTGGMGTITDARLIEPLVLDRIVKEVVEPTLDGAARDGFAFRGILFIGLMMTADGPKVLEYNVRFGDPETQAILVRLKTNLQGIFEAIERGSLARLRLEWTPGASACVVAANRGYPGKIQAGAVIQGLDRVDTDKVHVFHAGTSRRDDGATIATGGRVLAPTAAGADLGQALQYCYDSLMKIHWDGMHYRSDIGLSLLES